MNTEHSVEDELSMVGNIPFIKNPLSFFASTKNFRSFLSITDSDDILNDVQIAEKMFATLFISSAQPEMDTKLQVVRNVLKQRLRYPDINDQPDLLKFAKIWILPSKIHLTNPPSAFLSSFKDSIKTSQTEYNFDTLSCVKFELKDGAERMMIYKMIDDGFRPSLVIVKWSKDLDEDYATAYCAGHLVNSGYVLVDSKNGYSLYFYSNFCLYDTVSMKEICYGNPFVNSFHEETEELLKCLKVRKIENDAADTTSPLEPSST